MTTCILSYYRNRVKAGELLIYQTYTAHLFKTWNFTIRFTCKENSSYHYL